MNPTIAARTQGRPKAVLLMVHNGDSAQLDALRALHPAARVITLAPHVSK